VQIFENIKTVLMLNFGDGGKGFMKKPVVENFVTFSL